MYTHMALPLSPFPCARPPTWWRMVRSTVGKVRYCIRTVRTGPGPGPTGPGPGPPPGPFPGSHQGPEEKVGSGNKVGPGNKSGLPINIPY